MKNFIFLLIIFFFSCQKDVNLLQPIQEEIRTAPPPNDPPFPRYAIVIPTTGDTTGNNVTGARMNCDVVNLKVAQIRKSVWVSADIEVPGQSPIFFQTGYRDLGGGEAPFTQAWQNGVMIGVGVTILADPPLVLGQKTVFGFYNVAGTTKWRTTRSGIDCLEIELFGTVANQVKIATEESATTKPTRFEDINFFPAIEVQKNGQWISIPTGQVQFANNWGIQAVAANNVNMGSSYPIPESWTILW